MARDIEEFLRRAAERRRQQQGGGNAPAPPQRPARPPQQRQQPPQQRQPPPQQRQQPPARRLVIEDDSAYEQEQPNARHTIGRESISDHVKRHVDSTDISEHAEHLGDRLSQTDERVEARLKRRFNRDISSLDDRPSIQEAAPEIVTGLDVSAVARDIVELFQSPKTMRQAILIAEIMKRPEI